MLAFPSSLTQRTRARNLDKSRRPASKLLEIERLEQRELLDAGSFVTNLYHDLLHRAPGTQELGGWEAFLQNGGSTTQVARTFVASEEYRTDLIQSDYQNFLGRQGSPPEISAWLQSNPSSEQIEVQFLGSNEYFAEQGATAEGWIAGLYQEVLGRNPDSSDSTWLAQLSAGASRSTVATEITNSTEAREQSITAAYEQLLGRAPDAQGMQHWLALLNQGETTTDMVVGITGSAEYANKPASKEIESGITISAANTTNLTSPTSVAVFGQTVTFTAAVTVPPGSGTPSGNVSFLDGTTSVGTSTLSNGQALLSISSLAVGAHSITAVYQGNSNFESSTSQAFLETINQALTTTSLTSSASPTVFGQAVTFNAIVAAVAPGTGTPGGSVTFLDGSTSLGSASLSSGQASFTISTLSAGTHSITAVYQGSTSFASSTTTALSQVINQATTATTLTSSASPTVSGQAVTFTAIVAAVPASAGTPGGSVTFLDGSTSLGSASLSSGHATLTLSTLSAGTHSITAVYQGSTSFASSTTTALSQVINQATTATTLTSSASTAVFGQAVTFKAIVAAVAPGAGTPSGSVTFLDGSTSLGSASLSSGQATFTISTLSAGTHSITAVYQGSTSFASSTTTALSQVINRATTATTLTSSASTAVFGQAVTFTAIVAAVAPGAGTPGGSVTFLDGSTSLGSASLASGHATLTLSTLSAGTHSITAVYQGSTSFASSTTTALSQVINRATTATTLTSSASTAVFGQAVTFTAIVAAVAPGGGTPSGGVTFLDGSTSLGSASLSNGQASFTISTLSLGTHSITAVYQGSTSFASSTTTSLSQVINPATTATTLTSSASPTVTGQAVTFTAIVAAVAPGAGTPSGSVTFLDGSTSLGSASLSSGHATLTLSTLSAGTHSITAVYQGSTSFASSTTTSLSQVINPATTATTLTSSASPTVTGQAVTFTAIVAAVAPGAGTPSGSVTFLDGSTSLGSASLSSGHATLTLSTLSAGTHSITALYQGSTSFASSTTTALSQVINQATTATTLTSSASPTVSGQAVTFTAIVAVVAPGAGTPGGSVTFLDGSTTLGSASLSSGQATLTLSTLSAGTHSITTVYNGNANFLTSTSSAVIQEVNTQTATLTTNTVVVSSVDPVVAGSPVTFTVAVAPAASGVGIPTGTVTLTIDGVPQPAVALANGLATLSVPTLSAGSHSIVGFYSGDASFTASTSATFTEVSNSTYVASWQPPGLNVTNFGVVGNGVTDDTTALQNLINSSPSGSMFYFPAGTYLITGTVSFAGLAAFGIEGATTAAGLPASVIEGTATTGNLVSVNYGTGAGTFQINNMEFVGSDAGETAFYTCNAISASFDNCAFSGHIGLDLQSGFVVAVRSSKFIGAGGAAGSDIGLLAFGPTECMVSGSDFSGWTEGLRAAGTGISVVGSTFEQNGIGMNLGVDPSGNGHGLSRSSFNDLSLTANSTAIVANSVAFCYFSAITIQGSPNAPSGQSQVGLLVNFSQGTTFSGLQIGGGFSNTAVRVYSGQDSTFFACNASNSISTGLVWNVATGLVGVTFSNTPLGAIADVDDSTASGIATSAQGPVLNVTNYGLVGNGVTDDTAAFQDLINSATPGTTFYFPAGIYKVSATIDFSRLSSFTLLGDTKSLGGNEAGSTIVGNFAGVLLKADFGSGAGTFQMSNLNLRCGSTSGGICVYTRNAVLSSLQNLQITGNIGIEVVNPFMFSVSTVQFNGSISEGSNIGLLVDGGNGCAVEQCDFMGWQEGIRASGSGLTVFASRFEVCHIGMNLGIDPSGNSSPLQNASIAGLSMEANDIFINATNCINCSFEGIGTQGSTNAPSGMSQVGMSIGTCQGCTFSGLQMGGAYTNASILVSSASTNLLFDACSASNGIVGGVTWGVQSGATNITQLDCY